MKQITRAGIVLGLGLGGFLDGIVLHQILGWHHLVCVTETCGAETVAGLKQQITQDGVFHLGTWCLTLWGIRLLFRAARDQTAWTGRKLGSALLGGWGLFNFVEGLINHQLIGLHHVRPGHPREFLFDMAFLASGVGLVLIGWALGRAPTERSTSKVASGPA